jgi:hypothetical protein
LNALGIDMSADAPEASAMGLGTKRRLPGLKDTGFSLNGYFDAENPDLFLYTQVGLSNIPMTMAETGADGGACFIFQPVLAQYSPGGKVGDVYAFTVKGNGKSDLIQGTILYPKTTKTSSDTGTEMHLGAVTTSRIGTWAINAAGSGYSINDIITVVQAGGSGGTLIVKKVDTGGEVLEANLLTMGTGYAVATALVTTVSPNVGTGFKVNIISLNPASKAYALLHVFSASSGDTLDVKVQSDVDDTFASATDVITFTQATAAGSELKTADGPVTDTWWRVSFTIAGNGSESFSFAVSFGIL